MNRILLKLSGESLMGEKGYGIDEKRLADYAQQIQAIAQKGVQIGIVIGGGNIFRGLSGAQKGFDRVKGDQMGMLATVINAYRNAIDEYIKKIEKMFRKVFDVNLHYLENKIFTSCYCFNPYPIKEEIKDERP